MSAPNVKHLKLSSSNIIFIGFVGIFNMYLTRCFEIKHNHQKRHIGDFQELINKKIVKQNNFYQKSK